MLLWCPKTPSVHSVIADFFAEREIALNELIIHSDLDMCFVRAVWARGENWDEVADFESEFGESALMLKADFSVKLSQDAPSVGVFCSEQIYVLNDFLNKIDDPYYPAFEVSFICSSSDDCRKVADRFGIPFFYVSASTGNADIQQKQIDILQRYEPDWLVMPCCDTLLGVTVIAAANCPILSLQSSFLPSLKSEKAYEMAYDQGLKCLGATARLVESKKPGPIVTQDYITLAPCPSAAIVQDSGHEIERKVFANGFRKLVEHKVIVYNAKTIVFD